MNVKKKVTKFLSLLLSFTMAFSNVIPAYAMEIANSDSTTMIDGENIKAEERSLEDITVTYKQASSFFVTIPKTIVLDGWKQAAYSVKVTGDIESDQCVYVAPLDGIAETESIDFYMTDQATEDKKEDVVATVTHKKFHWNSTEVAEGYKETDNSISAPDLTAGTWKGTFQVSINLETMAEHKHNFVDGVCTGCGEKDPNAEHEHKYVDGKCDCGEIDPNHTHNYEDGKCTICGQEADPYEVAPKNEYTNWRYRLDTENQYIILERYNNTSTEDVIVYNSYEIGGTTYKTKISSNLGKWSYTSITSTNDYMFAQKTNIKTITFGNEVDTSECLKMGEMFWGCTALTNIEFGSNFNTRNTVNMEMMFYNCQSLTSLDLSSFDTANVTSSMYSMFKDCYSLIDINFGDTFDTSNVTSMSNMFENCRSLTNLDVSNFNTGNVTSMYSMFNYCSSLTNLDVSSFDTRNVTDMRNMFGYVPVTTIDVSNFDTSKVTKMSDMFRSCTGLTELDLTSFDTSNVTDMSYMFIDCSALEVLDLSSFNTSNVTKMDGMFRRASSLKTIYATSGKWSTSKASTSNMFAECGTSYVTYK